MDNSAFIVPAGKKVRLSDYNPAFTGEYSDKSAVEEKLQSDIKKMRKLQDVLNAQNDYGVLAIFQAMDAAGKDSTIKHVTSGVNPAGFQVFSFKQPSLEELDHDYMWRTSRALPERGRIGIFNRSYYEETLIARIHPEVYAKQQIPTALRTKKFWEQRFRHINDFEKYLTENGIVILKFFLHVSKNEQKKRFLERINNPDKNWKFSLSDASERQHWDEYMTAYEDVFNNTSTKYAPWHIIPADNKWFTRTAVADIIVKTLKSLNLKYPEVSEVHRANLEKARIMLENE